MAPQSKHDITHEFMDKVSDERWAAHTREHAVIAEALRQYKVDSNEWRAALSDLRSTFMNKETYDSKHDILLQQLDTMDKRVSFFENREKGAQGVLTSTRALIVTSAAVITTIITIVLFFTEKSS